MNANPSRFRFKRINPDAEVALAAAREREFRGVVHSLLKGGIYAFRFGSAGEYLFRFLPQPEDSRDAFSATVPFIRLTPLGSAGSNGNLALTIPQAKLIEDARRALSADPGFRSRLASKTNLQGITLRLSFKAIFLGFQPNAAEMAVQPVVLPANGFGNPVDGAKLRVGTAINQYIVARDSDGQLR